MVYQHLPHRLSRRSAEIVTIREVRQGLSTQESHQSLIHERAGLQGVAAALPSHKTPRRLHELVVDGPDQSILCIRDPGADLAEHGGHVPSCVDAHHFPPTLRGEIRLGDVSSFSHSHEEREIFKFELRE